MKTHKSSYCLARKSIEKLNHVCLVLMLCFVSMFRCSESFDYKDALRKSLVYFEAQRSGRLPHNQRVTWRHHSGLTDGLEEGVDLVGGYYDAGDNVKFGLPMAFTITLLSWSVMEFRHEIASAGELNHAFEAIKWGTDYFIKAHTHPHVLWAQVGDGDNDHLCWQRPEDMTTSRRAYKLDEENPGSEVAAETAAAMAASAIVFEKTNPRYSQLLLVHARQLFEFADTFRGKYDISIESAKGYYKSASGYKDELLWASLWLYKATGNKSYFDYAIRNAESFGGSTWSVAEFSWDLKYAGAQIIIAMLPLKGRNKEQKLILQKYHSNAKYYVCACMNKNNSTKVKHTPGGLLYTRRWNNMQYASSAALLLAVYSKHLKNTRQTLNCPRGSMRSQDILDFVKSQVDYILGSNPRGVSYLVGFGQRYPKRVHHRGASTVSYKDSKVFVGCVQGYDMWYNHEGPNPNVLAGALVGGPNEKDEFEDRRGEFEQTEACTYNTAPLVGIFAKLHELEKGGSNSSAPLP